MTGKVAFIIGNGTSRKAIDLNQLTGKAPIFGCNALYRSFDSWDYLIAIDEGMIKEISEAEAHGLFGDHTGTVIFPPEDERWESAVYSPRRRRSNAGMNAMSEALLRGHTILYCLGFDFILQGPISTDNVYAGTENYSSRTHANEVDNYHRIMYLEWFAKQHPYAKFVFVLPREAAPRAIDTPNIIGMWTDVFLEKLNKE